MKKLSFLIIAAALMVAGCSKDDDKCNNAYSNENYMYVYLNNALGFVQLRAFSGDNDNDSYLISPDSAARRIQTFSGCNGAATLTYIHDCITSTLDSCIAAADETFIQDVATNGLTGDIIVLDDSFVISIPGSSMRYRRKNGRWTTTAKILMLMRYYSITAYKTIR